MFDLALVLAFAATLFVGGAEFRRYGNSALLYSGMLLTIAALSGIVLLARSSTNQPSATTNMMAVAVLGGALCLIGIPLLLQRLIGRAVEANWLRSARALVKIRELLVPHLSHNLDLDLIDTIIEVRAGRTDNAIGRLKQTRDALAPEQRWRIEERIVMTYLYGRQWEQAIEHYERLLVGHRPPPSLRLFVEMVRGYCEVGNLEAAGELVVHLENSITHESSLSILLNRSRLVFLAYTGRVVPVAQLLSSGGALAEIPKQAKAYWVGIAHHYAGDRNQAIASLKKAAKLSGRDIRARQLASAAADRASQATGTPRVVSTEIAQLADHISEVTRTTQAGSIMWAPSLIGVRWSRIWVTISLLLANLGTFALVWLFFDTTSDRGALVRAGAYVAVVTEGGQYWRLITHMFLHVGLLHLALNAYGIWFLGKLCEQLYSSARMAFIYMGSGVGAIAISLLIGGTPLAVGASGAVLGLLGAALAELIVHRKRYPSNWVRTIVSLLLLLVVINIAIGILYPMIEQSVHLGGLAVGAGLGLILSRNTPFGRSKVMTVVSWGLFSTVLATLAWATHGKVTQSYGEAIRFEAKTVSHFPGVAADVPASWTQHLGRSITDPSQLILLSMFSQESSEPVAEVLAKQLHAEQYEGAREAGFASATREISAATIPVTMPPGWFSDELALASKDNEGPQLYRTIVFARRFGSHIVVGAAYIPSHLTEELSGVLFDILTTVRLDPTIAPIEKFNSNKR